MRVVNCQNRFDPSGQRWGGGDLGWGEEQKRVRGEDVWEKVVTGMGKLRDFQASRRSDSEW